MDYNTLIASSTTAGSIAGWINHQSITAVAPTIIQEAESAIYRRLRHIKMLTSTTGTMTAGGTSDFIAPPSDYLEDKLLYFTGTAFAKITRKTAQELVSNYCYDGSGNRVQTQPSFYTNDQTNIKFESPADQNYPWLLWYYQQPAALSATNTQNFLTNQYPRLFRCACMTSASEFMKDIGQGSYDRTYWEQMTEAEIMTAQAESDRSQHTVEAGMMLI